VGRVVARDSVEEGQRLASSPHVSMRARIMPDQLMKRRGQPAFRLRNADTISRKLCLMRGTMLGGVAGPWNLSWNPHTVSSVRSAQRAVGATYRCSQANQCDKSSLW
jgi:hypothetical protein